MSKELIYYHKWEKKQYKQFFQSIHELLNIRSLQFYMPFFSLYFYVHNKPQATRKLDLKRPFYIQKIKEITKERYYNSNLFLLGDLYNSDKNRVEEKEIFCKTIPIVDAMHCINNNYNFIHRNNYHLPSAYNFNTFKKINDMNNTAYIDVLCSYLFGRLTYNKINPSFPLFYGSVNGIGNYKHDITEEYHDIKIDKCFNETINKGFSLDMYISDDDNEDEEDDDNDDDKQDDESDIESIPRSSLSVCDNSSDDNSSDDNSSDDNSSEGDQYDDDYIANIKDIPIQLLFIEKLEGTLEDLLDDDINEEILLSCLFQISFALVYLQKHFQFTHNDLHINNVMYTETDTKYLYYKYNNIYYRVPTYGKVFKIIDFGRAIFTYRNKTFMNDVFTKHGEAGGQYTYPSQVDFMKNKTKRIIQPNYHFDLCRLSMTILEELNKDLYSDKTIEFLTKLCLNHVNESFCDMQDNFKLYIDIASDACNALPREIITNEIFKIYRIKKKLFPRKSFYTL